MDFKVLGEVKMWEGFVKEIVEKKIKMIILKLIF